jgi:NAD(P)-dependent dehydrogenase (short-subunit alcohol dehydrogenase family)
MSEHNRLTTPFGATTTAAEVASGIDVHGRRVVVTGGASGIGTETARILAACGADVTIAARDTDAGARVAAEIAAGVGRPVGVAALDLADLESVAQFVAGWDGPLDILVNNAGIMACPETRTDRGWELQFATNHCGHFALAAGLHDALAAAGDARVVSVSSLGHKHAAVDFDDIHFERRPYNKWIAYGQSKTANVLFAVEGARRWAADGITVNALHPGAIVTNLLRHLPEEDLDPSRGLRFPKNVEQGAATSVFVATSPLLKGVSGRYFEDCNEAGPLDPKGRSGVAPHAVDPEAAERLWNLSEAAVAS